MRSFGQLENDIMRVVWDRNEPITIREIADSLNTSRSLAHTTIITVAERLREKGWLTRQRQGRSFYYEASITSEDYSAQLMTQVLEAAHDRPAALLRFAGQLDAAETAALREALGPRRDGNPTTAQS